MPIISRVRSPPSTSVSNTGTSEYSSRRTGIAIFPCQPTQNARQRVVLAYSTCVRGKYPGVVVIPFRCDGLDYEPVEAFCLPLSFPSLEVDDDSSSTNACNTFFDALSVGLEAPNNGVNEDDDTWMAHDEEFRRVNLGKANSKSGDPNSNTYSYEEFWGGNYEDKNSVGTRSRFNYASKSGYIRSRKQPFFPHFLPQGTFDSVDICYNWGDIEALCSDRNPLGFSLNRNVVEILKLHYPCNYGFVFGRFGNDLVSSTPTNSSTPFNINGRVASQRSNISSAKAWGATDRKLPILQPTWWMALQQCYQPSIDWRDINAWLFNSKLFKTSYEVPGQNIFSGPEIVTLSGHQCRPEHLGLVDLQRAIAKSANSDCTKSKSVFETGCDIRYTRDNPRISPDGTYSILLPDLGKCLLSTLLAPPRNLQHITINCRSFPNADIIIKMEDDREIQVTEEYRHRVHKYLINMGYWFDQCNPFIKHLFTKHRIGSKSNDLNPVPDENVREIKETASQIDTSELLSDMIFILESEEILSSQFNRDEVISGRAQRGNARPSASGSSSSSASSATKTELGRVIVCRAVLGAHSRRLHREMFRFLNEGRTNEENNRGEHWALKGGVLYVHKRVSQIPVDNALRSFAIFLRWFYTDNIIANAYEESTIESLFYYALEFEVDRLVSECAELLIRRFDGENALRYSTFAVQGKNLCHNLLLKCGEYLTTSPGVMLLNGVSNLISMRENSIAELRLRMKTLVTNLEVSRVSEGGETWQALVTLNQDLDSLKQNLASAHTAVNEYQRSLILGKLPFGSESTLDRCWQPRIGLDEDRLIQLHSAYFAEIWRFFSDTRMECESMDIFYSERRGGSDDVLTTTTTVGISNDSEGSAKLRRWGVFHDCALQVVGVSGKQLGGVSDWLYVVSPEFRQVFLHSSDETLETEQSDSEYGEAEILDDEHWYCHWAPSVACEVKQRVIRVRGMTSVRELENKLFQAYSLRAAPLVSVVGANSDNSNGIGQPVRKSYGADRKSHNRDHKNAMGCILQ